MRSRHLPLFCVASVLLSACDALFPTTQARVRISLAQSATLTHVEIVVKQGLEEYRLEPDSELRALIELQAGVEAKVSVEALAFPARGMALYRGASTFVPEAGTKDVTLALEQAPRRTGTVIPMFAGECGSLLR